MTLPGLSLAICAPVFANECEPVDAFIQLGQSASKCVAAIQANSEAAKETLSNYRPCSEVKMIRTAVEQGVDKMPAEQINACASKQQNKSWSEQMQKLSDALVAGFPWKM